MTEQEGIKELKVEYLGDSNVIVEAKKMTIKALETVQKLKERNMTMEVLENYMQFEDECVKKGFTFKSILEAREKQIAKKPKITRSSCSIPFGICPNCGTEINRLDNPFYHTDKDCLQKVDWSEV